jgi:hypothetical protein
MKLPEKLTSLIAEFLLYCRRALETKVDFAAAPETWTPRWEERSQWIAKAQAADRKLRPVFEAWKTRKGDWGLSLEKEMALATDELVSALDRVCKDNAALHKAIVSQREDTRQKLSALRKSTRAIACYAGQA